MLKRARIYIYLHYVCVLECAGVNKFLLSQGIDRQESRNALKGLNLLQTETKQILWSKLSMLSVNYSTF